MSLLLGLGLGLPLFPMLADLFALNTQDFTADKNVKSFIVQTVIASVMNG